MKYGKNIKKVLIILSALIFPTTTLAGPGDLSGAVAPIPPGSINMNFSGPIIPGFPSLNPTNPLAPPPPPPPPPRPSLSDKLSAWPNCNYYPNTMPLSHTRTWVDAYRAVAHPRQTRPQQGVDYVECILSTNIGTNTNEQIHKKFRIPADNRPIYFFAGTAAGEVGVLTDFLMHNHTRWINCSSFTGISSSYTPTPPGACTEEFGSLIGSVQLPGTFSPYVSDRGFDSLDIDAYGYTELNTPVNRSLFSSGDTLGITYGGRGYVSSGYAAGQWAGSPPLSAIAEFVIGDAAPTPTPTPTPTPIPAPVLRSVTTNCPCAIR